MGAKRVQKCVLLHLRMEGETLCKSLKGFGVPDGIRTRVIAVKHARSGDTPNRPVCLRNALVAENESGLGQPRNRLKCRVASRGQNPDGRQSPGDPKDGRYGEGE